MRPARQVKVISSQLENLEFLKKHLENVINEIEKILTKGRTWIEETDTVKSFTQMSHFLTMETFKCSQKCLEIAKEDKDTTELNSDTECESSESFCISSPENINDKFKDNVKIKLDEIDQWMTRHSTKFVDIKQRLKRLEKQNEIISSQEKDRNTNLQFEEIMKELRAASDFMSKLQSQTDILADLKNEHEKELDKLKIEFKAHEAKINDMTENHRSNVEKLEKFTENLEKDINSLTMNVQQLKKDTETVSSDLVSFKTSNDKTLEVYKDNNNGFQKQIELQVSSKVDVLFKDITYLKNLNISSKRIAFTVGLTNDITVTYGSIIKYDTIITNIGDCYNIGTGKFTCPVDGIYLFHVSTMADENTIVSLALYQNLDEIISVYCPSEVQAGLNSNMVTIHLKEKDEIFLISDYEKSILYGQSAGTFNTFTGFILSAD